MRFIAIAVITLTLILAPSAVRASVDDKVSVEIPRALDPQFRAQKAGRFEISPYGGAYLGNTLGQTFISGLRGYYHINNTFALGASYGYSRLLTDAQSSFGADLRSKNMHAVALECMISNDAALRAGNHIIEMDFYAALGPAFLTINGALEPAGLIGGGVRLYTPIRWLAFRIDVNNFAHFTDRPGRDNFDFDVSFLGGVSIMLGPK